MALKVQVGEQSWVEYPTTILPGFFIRRASFEVSKLGQVKMKHFPTSQVTEEQYRKVG